MMHRFPAYSRYRPALSLFFFFNDTATTEIYTLSLHDALPISCTRRRMLRGRRPAHTRCVSRRSEEHTSELQSRLLLVCRLLLEKKKTIRQSRSRIYPHSIWRTVPSPLASL